MELASCPNFLSVVSRLCRFGFWRRLAPDAEDDLDGMPSPFVVLAPCVGAFVQGFPERAARYYEETIASKGL